MQWLKENIFIRIIIPLIAGIILTYYLNIDIAFLVLTVVNCSSIFIILPMLNVKARFRYQYLSGVSLALLWVICGYSLKFVSTGINQPTYFGNYLEDTDYFIGRVADEPVLKDKTNKVSVDVTVAHCKSEWKNVTGKGIVYLKKDSLSGLLKYGDVILFRNNFLPIKKDRNPDAIDYSFILNNLNIFHSAFVGNTQWTLLKHHQGFSLYTLAINTRNSCVALLNKNIPDHEAASVAASLLLGYRGDMSYELQNAYIVAGVIHILAVSGMQVGMVFLFLNFLLRWTDKYSRFKIVKTLLLIAAIIFFTLITGVSGSVVRAAVMLSLILIGKQFKRYISSINILFATAFILILFQPTIIFDVGFELSFFAIWGILIFHKPLRSVLFTQNKMLDALLNITAVSLAAQAGTLPFVLYYFHQFPVHFLLVNLVVIPLSAVIIYGLILLLCISFIHSLAILLGMVLSVLINGMDGFVRMAQHLPLAVYYMKHFDIIFLLMLLFAMIMVYVFTVERRLIYLNFALGIIAVMTLISFCYEYHDYRTKNIVVFEHSRQLIFTCRNGSEAVLFCSMDAHLEESSFEKYIQTYFRNEGVRKVTVFDISKEGLYDNNSITVKGDVVNFFDYRIKFSKKDISLLTKGSELSIFPTRMSNNASGPPGVNSYYISEKGPLIINL